MLHQGPVGLCSVADQGSYRDTALAWLAYDRALRNQLAIDPTKRWNTLDGDLQASTILGARTHTALPGLSHF